MYILILCMCIYPCDVSQALPKLIKLDISWNGFSSYHDDVAVLRRHCPALCCLDASNNPWNKVMWWTISLIDMIVSLFTGCWV